MNPTLVAFGLLMVAAALTVLAGGPRTWLLAIAQGLGIQAIIGGVMSAVQVGWFLEGSGDMSPAERITTTVQGIPFNAAGWTGRSLFEHFTADAHPGAMSDLDGYLPIAGVQIAVVALVIAWRKMQDESLCDVVVLFIIGLLLANSICNVSWPWWGA
jgi:hypothetical protein